MAALRGEGGNRLFTDVNDSNLLVLTEGLELERAVRGKDSGTEEWIELVFRSLLPAFDAKYPTAVTAGSVRLRDTLRATMKPVGRSGTEFGDDSG